MKNSERNRLVLENFLLHLTHCSEDVSERDFDEKMSWTPRELYKQLNDYIEEDHVDGKGNPEDDKEVEPHAIGVKVPMPNGYMMVDINLDDMEMSQLSFYNESDMEANPKNPWCNGDQWGKPKVAICYEKDTSCFDDNHLLKEELILKPYLKKFRVFAEVSNRCYIDVNATTEDEAMALAENIDGGDFISDEQSGDWKVYQATKIS